MAKKGRVTAHDVDVRFAVCPNSVAHDKKAFLIFFLFQSRIWYPKSNKDFMQFIYFTDTS